MGKEGQQVPLMNPEWIEIISKRYIELYEVITGKSFIPSDISDQEIKERVENSLLGIQGD